MVNKMHDASLIRSASFGWLGFALGAAALVLTMITFWAGPFAPQQSAGVTLGELAAEIVKSAARSAAGQAQPEPVAPDRNIDDYLKIGVSLLAGLAIVAGFASFVRNEPKRAAFSGIALGGLAVGFQLFTWTIMLIAGVIAIASLIYTLRDTLQDIFGGLFDA
jgi:hypothetical protein